jgi:hypothetical protein
LLPIASRCIVRIPFAFVENVIVIKTRSVCFISIYNNPFRYLRVLVAKNISPINLFNEMNMYADFGLHFVKNDSLSSKLRSTSLGLEPDCFLGTPWASSDLGIPY